jgi:DNA-binding response OmpR family regulator
VLKNSNVLLIEDDEAIREMYRLKFANKKIDISVAEDGVQALKLALRLRPFLVLLDLRIPTIDGVEVLRKLRRYEWGREMKVIVLTNISESEAPKPLAKLGYDYYMIKAHSTPTKVVNLVKQFLSEKV